MIGVGTCRISAKAREYVNQVLMSNRLSYGPFTQRLERKFAASHDSRFAIMTASGTCALLIALAALKKRYGWADDDEVIVPSVTFIATSNIILQLNMKLVFVDVDPVYYELNPTKIEAAITSRTRCIIPVHLFGCPCDMDPIMSIAKKHNIRVIEDSCETMFVGYKGRSIGSFGDVSCFSTYVAHLLVTGVGGFCVTNDPWLATMIRSLMNHGRDSIYISIDDDKNKSEDEFKLIIQKRFRFVQMGYSFRVTEMEGALGLAEFESREEMMKIRLENAAYYRKKLNGLGDRIQLPTIRPESGHAFMMFPVVLRQEPKKNIVEYLESSGIETREMMPLITQPFYQELFNIDEEDYPVARWINKNGFYIGCHQNVSEAEREYVVDVFYRYFKGAPAHHDKSCLIVMAKLRERPAAITIEKFLESIQDENFDEYVLLDANSDDIVISLFSAKGYKVVHESVGKGLLLKKALSIVQSENIVLIGIDGSDDTEDISNILVHLKNGNDVVVASRFMMGGGRETNQFLSYRSIGNRFFSFFLSVVTNRNVTDCNNLFRGFKKSAIEKLNLKQKGDGIMFEMTLNALGLGLKHIEVPTLERKSYIKSRKQQRMKSAIHFCWIMAKYIFCGPRRIARTLASANTESSSCES